VAMALTAFFAVKLGWFPAFGDGAGVLGSLWHLTLPAVSLALSSCGLVARATRSSMLTELSREYVDTARVRGLSERRIVWGHAFPNAMPPVITLAGLVLAGLLVTTTLVETAFGLNGVGSLLVQSVETKDFPVVQAIVLIVVAVFAVTNLVVDLIQPVINPQLKAVIAR
jgi:peptide/nickel transport system permease protein